MQDFEEEDEYAFIVKSASQPEKVKVTVDGVVVAMRIDSGASTIVIDKTCGQNISKKRLPLRRVIRSLIFMVVNSH